MPPIPGFFNSLLCCAAVSRCGRLSTLDVVRGTVIIILFIFLEGTCGVNCRVERKMRWVTSGPVVRATSQAAFYVLALRIARSVHIRTDPSVSSAFAVSSGTAARMFLIRGLACRLRLRFLPTRATGHTPIEVGEHPAICID